MIENKQEPKEINELYKEYKENTDQRKNYQLDLMKFLEVHKRGIEFYNNFGLASKKKSKKE